jgi:hypothetical protein|tara:strand:- start:570 stop:1040 length:471 start_codon:yes stop_codon:yes gene_type:complete
MAIVAGWGRGTFGQLTFGEPIPVVVTGVVGTSALGDGTAVQAAAVTGVSAVASTTTLGDESVTCAANVAVTGVAGTSAVGNESLITNNYLNVTLAAMTSALGSVDPSANADVIITEGFELTSALNSVNVWQRVGRNITTTYTAVSTTQTPNWQEVA